MLGWQQRSILLRGDFKFGGSVVDALPGAADGSSPGALAQGWVQRQPLVRNADSRASA